MTCVLRSNFDHLQGVDLKNNIFSTSQKSGEIMNSSMTGITAQTSDLRNFSVHVIQDSVFTTTKQKMVDSLFGIDGALPEDALETWKAKIRNILQISNPIELCDSLCEVVSEYINIVTSKDEINVVTCEAVPECINTVTSKNEINQEINVVTCDVVSECINTDTSKNEIQAVNMSVEEPKEDKNLWAFQKALEMFTIPQELHGRVKRLFENKLRELVLSGRCPLGSCSRRSHW
jgi:hypothetical protein